MSSAAKTLKLLSYFSTTQPEIGLSRLSKLAGRDKATTYRHLQALEETGFIEQNVLTKSYRLGPSLLQLAKIREATVPRKAAAEAALLDLANVTGETAHVSVLSGTTLYALTSCESLKHSTRAIIDIKTFPLHATASGLSALAFGPSTLMDLTLENLQVFTKNTPQTAAELTETVNTVRETGFGHSDRSYEDEIHGLSAPLFDHDGNFAGAVSVASVATRFTPELERIIQHHLIATARTITKNWGGAVPSEIEAIWAKSLTQTNALETAS